MPDAQVGSLTLFFFVLISSAHLLGYVFTRLRQPRVIGEILAGVALGPLLLGKLAPGLGRDFAAHAGTDLVQFVYWLGLLLLMFVSGAETRGLFQREDRRDIAWIASLGTGLPFVAAVLVGAALPLGSLLGPAAHRGALLLVLGIAVAVTSIPVISRIFHDLGILHTRFARLVLGIAMVEDIALWAVLAIATALAASATLPQQAVAQHILVTLLYFAAGLALAPGLLRRVAAARWNFLFAVSPVGYLVAVLFAYTAVAAALGVSLVFAAFLAGFAACADRERLAAALDALSRFAFAVFIPVYFVLVGYKLDLGGSFSLAMLAAFLPAACAGKLLAVAAGARLAGFRRLDVVNLAVATNARGGPGIVLASVAADAGIISPAFYTTLVLTAVLTSQAAGAWLELVLRRGWPLLSGAAEEPAASAEAAVPRLAA